MSRDRQSGMTLIEVTVVMVLAAVVTLGMIGFYISSQASWLDASTEALAQRDATLIVQAISDSVRKAAAATTSNAPDAEHQTLSLYSDPTATTAFCRFFWGSDSLVHVGGPGGSDDHGPVAASKVSRFEISTTGGNAVLIDLVELPCPPGAPVQVSSAAALINRPQVLP